jgi:hypothetical protein
MKKYRASFTELDENGVEVNGDYLNYGTSKSFLKCIRDVFVNISGFEKVIDLEVEDNAWCAIAKSKNTNIIYIYEIREDNDQEEYLPSISVL